METENSLRAFCQRQNRPELLAEWDAAKNAPLTPETIHKGSHRRVWWRCSSGHSWQAEIQRRTSRESKCPFCANRLLWTGSNDLGTVRPDLAAQWDFEKNSPLTPRRRPGQQQERGLVEVREGPLLAGGHPQPGPGQRLPGLQPENRRPRGKRPGDPFPGAGRPMEPGAQRGPAPLPGGRAQQQEGLVAVSSGP